MVVVFCMIFCKQWGRIRNREKEMLKAINILEGKKKNNDNQPFSAYSTLTAWASNQSTTLAFCDISMGHVRSSKYWTGRMWKKK